MTIMETEQTTWIELFDFDSTPACEVDECPHDVEWVCSTECGASLMLCDEHKRKTMDFGGDFGDKTFMWVCGHCHAKIDASHFMARPV